MTAQPLTTLVSAVLILWSAQSHAATAEDVTEALENRWYVAEVLIFERATSAAEVGGEELLRTEARVHPRGVMSLIGQPYPWALDDLTSEQVRRFRLGQGRDLGPIPHQRKRRAKRTTTEPVVEDVIDGVAEEAEPPTPAELFTEALSAFEAELSQRQLQPEPAVALVDARTRLERNRRHTTLWHERWLLSVPPRGQAQPILIQTGQGHTDAEFALEGSLGISIGRFLHLDARLWLSHAELPPSPPPTTPAAPLPAAMDTPSGDFEAEPPGQDGLADVEPLVGHFVIDERRRMRSEELHYIDHPNFGVLAWIEPVAIPDALVEALTAVEEAVD